MIRAVCYIFQRKLFDLAVEVPLHNFCTQIERRASRRFVLRGDIFVSSDIKLPWNRELILIRHLLPYDSVLVCTIFAHGPVCSGQFASPLPLGSFGLGVSFVNSFRYISDAFSSFRLKYFRPYCRPCFQYFAGRAARHLTR